MTGLSLLLVNHSHVSMDQTVCMPEGPNASLVKPNRHRLSAWKCLQTVVEIYAAGTDRDRKLPRIHFPRHHHTSNKVHLTVDRSVEVLAQHLLASN